MPDISQFDHEFLTAGSQSAEGEKLAGLVQQNLTPEEQKRLEEIMPILEEFNMLVLKAQTGEFPEGAEEMGFINGQGMPEQGMMEGRVPQDMQNQQRPPLQAVEGQMPQNAPEMMAEGGYARSGSTYSTVMDQAKAIVREKHPRQARYLDVLNIVMKPDMEGHSEYRSGDYDDSKEYGYKHTIEINPKYSKTPEEIASTIAGETLHHMKDKDPKWKKLWQDFRNEVRLDPDFYEKQEERQQFMNKGYRRQRARENRERGYAGTEGIEMDGEIIKKPLYQDKRDIDQFIDASALDEYIRAYQFYDDPIAGEHYEKGWKNDPVFEKYKPQLEGFRKYLGMEPRGMQMGGVAAGPVGVVNEQGADSSGVADDVPAESDGFVINAAAVRHAGLRDINDMIQDATSYAKKQGMKLNFGKTPIDAEKILVSNGEVVIPDVLADIIGYDRLEKINKRGERETEKVIQEEKQQQQQPPPPQKPTQPVMRAAEGGQMKDLFPAESAIALEELEEVRKSKEPDRELAARVYEALTVPETGVFEDPFIRTEFIPEGGSTAYGPVQITKGLMEDPRYSDIDDPYESIARQRLINQGEKFARFGNRDWERLLESGEITQKEADEAAALYEYGKSGDYVRDDRDKEDYRRYAVSIIDRKLKDLEKEGFKDRKKLEKFLKEWNPKASKKYIKEFFDTFEKNLDN